MTQAAQINAAAATPFARQKRGTIELARQSAVGVALDLDLLPIPAAQFAVDSGELLRENAAFRAAFMSGPRLATISDLASALMCPRLEDVCAKRGPETVFVDVAHATSKRHFHVAGRRDVTLGVLALTFLDITDRIRIEQSHREHQTQLFYASKIMSVGEMAAVISHELNHPLATCMNFLGGIHQRLSAGGESDKKLIAPLDNARDQVSRAVEIISRIREFVKSREPKYEHFALEELFINLGEWLQLDLAKHQIAYRIDLPKSLPLVWADRVMLLQVLVNLAKNAVEVMQNPLLICRELRVGALRESDKTIAIWVADSGGGVPLDTQQRLFAPFSSTKQKGMGIGLSICRSIVEYHGGRLWHEPGGQECGGPGAKFIFTLPCSDSAAVACPVPATSPVA
jgi:C4-dicarboxylate-specific signal transduction histidine kinase